jgi:ribosomal protein S18 acetylase RimI-like enzyme
MNTVSPDALEIIVDLPIARWPEFRDLRLRALESEPAAFAQTHEVASAYPDDLWQGRLQEVLDGRSWIVFAERADMLVGMCGAFQTDDDRDRRSATIWGVFVDEQERGHGIGDALLTAIRAQLASAGILTATLTVNREQTAAVRLYERHGFRIVGHEIATLGDGQEHDELVMELLSPRPQSSC